MDNQVTISGCLAKFLIVCTWNGQMCICKGEFWLQIYGDNYFSLFGCLAILLVVPGALTTEISNTEQGMKKTMWSCHAAHSDPV